MPSHHGLIDHSHRTHPLVWCIASVFAICICIVIIIGLTIFIGYLIIRPKVPFVSIIYARLDNFDSSQFGVLNTQLSLQFKAENDNLESHARFSSWVYDLSFHGIKIARLKNSDFSVNKNDSRTLTYVVKSESIPLDQHQMALVDLSITSNTIVFGLKGGTRASWNVGPIKSVKFWLRLNCELKFQVDGTIFDSNCSSKSK